MEKFKKISREKFVKALKWIVPILKENKIKFNVLGGLAAYAYGSKRMLVDIDLSMSLEDMKKLNEIAKNFVVEEPWNGTSETSQWRGYYMELNYEGIAIEIGEAKNTEFLNKNTHKWEKFPDGLDESINKKVLGLTIPVMPLKNLLDYKRKLGRNVDIIDLKNLTK